MAQSSSFLIQNPNIFTVTHAQANPNMDVLSNKIARLATYMPLGSYVIYTALQTYAFSLGPSNDPNTFIYVNTTVTTLGSNCTCIINAPLGPSCNEDQKNGLIVALAFGFFTSLFLSFIKRVPPGGTPPLSRLLNPDESIFDKLPLRMGVM